jgi:hypothetical protein
VNVKLASALAFAGGVVTGALVMWRGAGSHFRQVADDEIEEMRVYYSARLDEAVEELERYKEENVDLPEPPETEYGPDGWQHKDGEPDTTTAEAAKALLEYQGNDSFAYKAQDYIILTQREFEEGPPDDYDQCTVTYWALDGFLTDDRDKQLEVKKAIGELDPAWFGEKSVDPNVCYIRNTRLKIDFEVYRELESYGKKVLGLGDDSG